MFMQCLYLYAHCTYICIDANACLDIVQPLWPSWQGESGVQSFDLDGVGSIPAIPPTQFTCFIDEFNKLA